MVNKRSVIRLKRPPFKAIRQSLVVRKRLKRMHKTNNKNMHDKQGTQMHKTVNKTVTAKELIQEAGQNQISSKTTSVIDLNAAGELILSLYLTQHPYKNDASFDSIIARSIAAYIYNVKILEV